MQTRWLSFLFLAALPTMAQLPAPNKAGVSAGHDVLRSKDAEAANKFWQALGGQPVQFGGRLNLIKFPGVLLLTVGGGQGQRESRSESCASGGTGRIGRVVAGFHRLFGERSESVARKMGAVRN
jgi:hypothetical protein